LARRLDVPFVELDALVHGPADLVLWLDLPVRVWLPRGARRTCRRLRGRELLWNENRESVALAILGWNSLFAYALRTHLTRRRQWPRELAGYPVVRLRTAEEVRRFLAGLGRANISRHSPAEKPSRANKVRNPNPVRHALGPRWLRGE
jgi:hypothetical protein